MRIKQFYLMLVMAVMAVAAFTSCHDKDSEPDYPAGVDKNLLGTWESKIILEEKSSDLTLTFYPDLTVEITEKLVMTDAPVVLTAKGEYKAENGVLDIKITECSDPELVGFTYQGKYEVTTLLVHQLYLEYFPLFPFDHVLK